MHREVHIACVLETAPLNDFCKILMSQLHSRPLSTVVAAGTPEELKEKQLVFPAQACQS